MSSTAVASPRGDPLAIMKVIARTWHGRLVRGRRSAPPAATRKLGEDAGRMPVIRQTSGGGNREGGCPALVRQVVSAIAFTLAFFVLAPAASAQTPPAAATAAPAAADANAPASAPAANKDPFRLNIGLEGTSQPGQVSVAVQIVLVMTLLSVAPSIVLLMTTFTRLVIVLGFVRTALGTPSSPSNQIVIGLSLFLTFFLMGPVFDRVHKEALGPYLDGQIVATEALDRATVPLKDFMLKQTRTRDIEYFLQLGGYGPTAVKDLPIRVVIPAFVISELQTAFQMGFLLFLPFLVIDFLVGSVLMAMGMMMMPPVTVALPLKLLLFVLVDGWHLVVRSLVQSFVT